MADHSVTRKHGGGKRGTTPIEYLDRRIAELQCERPSTESGRCALAIAIRELERIRLALKIEVVNQLQAVMREAETVQ